MADDEGSSAPAKGLSTDPKISARLMLATYIIGVAGLLLALQPAQKNPSLYAIGCFLAVGVCGIVSFVRHSVFHRSDAARMGWDLGRRNNFQIEVGLANLAWGLAAIAAVVLGWGIVAEATTFIVSGFYMLGVSVMQVFAPEGEGRAIGPLLGIISFGVLLTIAGAMGMMAA